MKSITGVLVSWFALAVAAVVRGSEPATFDRILLSGPWRMQSSAVEMADGASLSQVGGVTRNWYSVKVPTTVLNALVMSGVHPDPRVGLNAYQIPDSSDEFNQEQNLAQYSHNAVGRFPEPGDEELLAGPARDFQVFDPLDFLAEVTQHIPDREHLIRYSGWYSSKTRGQRAQRELSATAGTAAPARAPTAREARQGWAALIRQVYEANPLCCPRCGAELKIIAFIERRQTEVIRLR